MMRTPLTTLTAAAALALAAGTALAQPYCTFVYRTGIPDFDQRRDTASGIAGLPGGGDMYCVPTAVVNNLAYMASHGYPGAMLPWMPVGGNWQNYSYNLTTFGISAMGQQFDTDAVNGTSGYGTPLIDWLGDHLPNDYLIVSSVALDPDSDSYPTPEQMAAQLSLGAMVQMHIGWFQQQGSHWERTGGHVVSLVGVWNGCGENPRVYYRDPWTGSSESQTTQSTFTTANSSVSRHTSLLSWPNDSANYSMTHWRLDAYSGATKGFLGGWRSIWPNFGVGIDTVAGAIKFHFPKLAIPGGAGGMQGAIQLGGTIRSMDLLPYHTGAVALIALPIGPVGANRRLVHANFADGSVRTITSFGGTPGPVALDRNGDVFVLDGRTLKRVRFADGSVRSARLLALDLDDMYFDDRTDQVVGLSIDDRKIVRLDRTLGTYTERSLPAAFPAITGDGSVTPHPLTGRLWICLGDGSTVYEINEATAAGGLGVTPKVLTGADDPKFLQFKPNGDPITLENGVLREYTTDPSSGRWVAGGGSGLNGQAFGGRFRLPRSRTNESPNYQLLSREGPNLVPPSAGPVGIPDCLADVAGLGGTLGQDGQLTTDDIVVFLQQFFGGGMSIADVGSLGGNAGADGQLTPDDIVVFLAAFFSGCP